MNFNANTTTGKAVKTIVWVAVSAAVTALISYFSSNPSVFNPVIVGVVNVVLVALKNFFDKSVPNI